MQLDITKPFLCFGRLGGNYLLVQATHRAYRIPVPKAAERDALDNSGEWLHTRVDIAAGNFRGRFAAHFHVTDFRRFQSELAALSDALAHSEVTNRAAHFRPPNGALRLTIEAREREVFTATCEATDTGATDALLLFTLRFDRAGMPDIMRRLDMMLAEFPPTGDETRDAARPSVKS